MAYEAENISHAPLQDLDVFIVDTTGGNEALILSDELRRQGIAVDRGFDQRSMKAQMKAADRSGAQFAIIIGTDELAAYVRNMTPGEFIKKINKKVKFKK